MAGLRSTSAAGLLPVLKRFDCRLSVLAYLAGLVQIFLWSTSMMHNRTYMSENALQPGVVDEQFYDTTSAINFLSDLRSFAEKNSNLGVSELSSALLQYVQTRFSALRNVDTQLHNFTIEYPPIFAAQPVNGHNLVAVARSKRTAHTESVMIAVPFRLPSNSQSNAGEAEEDTFASISLVYALFKQLRANSYWSRDLVFVLHSNGPVGLEALLDAYHDTRTSTWLKTSALTVHGGALQCAIALELSSLSNVRFVDLLLAGLHGRLPNLDLVNVAVRVGAKHGLIARIHGISTPGSGGYDDDYEEQVASAFRLDTALRRATAITAFVHAQAAASTLGGNHALFSRFAIESLTLKFSAASVAKGNAAPSSQTVLSLGRFMEALLRSVNNAMERFHQSYFFYVMAGSDRFVSIGTYYPALACLTVPLLLRALIMYAQLSSTNPGTATQTDADPNSAESEATDEEQVQNERVLNAFIGRNYSVTLLSRLVHLLPLLLSVALFAVISYTSCNYFLYLATSFRLQQSDALTLGLACVCFASLFYPRYFANDFSLLGVFAGSRREERQKQLLQDKANDEKQKQQLTQKQKQKQKEEKESETETETETETDASPVKMQADLLRSCVDELEQLRETLQSLKQSAGLQDEKAAKAATSSSNNPPPRVPIDQLEFVYDYRMLTLVVTVSAALYMHCVALFNISLALLIALIYVPLLTWIARPYDFTTDTLRKLAARKSFSARVSHALRSRAPFFARSVCFLLASPVTVIGICALSKYSGTAATLSAAARRVKLSPSQVYADLCAYMLRLFIDEAFFGSWQLMLVTLCLVPIWLTAYTLIWMARKPNPKLPKTTTPAATKAKAE